MKTATSTAGENEDALKWSGFVMDAGICTYLYGFCAPPRCCGGYG